MNQKIDFYQRFGKENLIPKSVLILCMSWLSVFFIYGVWVSILMASQSDLLEELTASKRQNNQLVQEINVMAQLGRSSGLSALSQQLQMFHDKRLKKQRFVHLLQDPMYSNLNGFSDVMLGLSRQHKEGVSLKRIEVTDSGSIFSMTGTVRNPEDIPAYVVRLGDEAAFANMVFEKLLIRETKLGQELKFEIRSQSKRG
ncbi:MAG: hypothetical protein JKY88_09290 [Pseudomonadales bacterium]|nr:hypothetical protein [Pseudomonadales bacterium]